MSTNIDDMADEILGELETMSAILETLTQASIEDINPDHLKTLALMLSIKTSLISEHVKLIYKGEES